MASFDVSITNNHKVFDVNISEIEQIIVKMLEYICNDADIIASSALKDIKLETTTLCVDVLFCNDEEIKSLNSSFRAKDKPTDVLTFALYADNQDINFAIPDYVSLGEIVVSIDTANKQAEERNNTLNQEINFLLSHGILHLLGFDHPDEESLDDMHYIQEQMTNYAT